MRPPPSGMFPLKMCTRRRTDTGPRGWPPGDSGPARFRVRSRCEGSVLKPHRGVSWRAVGLRGHPLHLRLEVSRGGNAMTMKATKLLLVALAVLGLGACSDSPTPAVNDGQAINSDPAQCPVAADLGVPQL